MDVHRPWPYAEQRYNEQLSPAIPRALARELFVYGEHLDRGAQAAFRGGAYRATYRDIPSVQLALRLGFAMSPAVAAQIQAQARPYVPPKVPGLRLPKLPWQK